jgi:hypothetical protein
MSEACGVAFAVDGAPDACGQREESCESTGAVGAIAPGAMPVVAAAAAGAAEVAGCGSGQTERAGGALSSTGAFGASSAWASASDLGALPVACGAGFAAAIGSMPDVRAGASSSPRMYQQ